MLEKKKILIFGAGGLLGSRIVLGALKNGATVIATDIDIEKTTKALSNNGINTKDPSLIITHLDITDESAVKDFFNNQDGITGAVNATYPRNKTYGTHFFDVSLESFNNNLSLHLGSAFLFAQQCAIYFKKHQTPISVVTISSIYGVVAPKFDIYNNTTMTVPVEYAAIKSAILHLNKYIAAYVKDSHFRINSVSPGGIFDNQPKPFLNAYKKNTHGTGMLDKDDLIGSIMFLLSDHSKFITGQNIIVDDGFSN
jgi:NAD(P)-dependent dehydrogenase (short-subunit alcohol dehydrogenase family)